MRRIFIAGHKGMVGSALVRLLRDRNGTEIVTASRDELDLTDSNSVASFFDRQRVQEVYLAAAKVGGIHANDTYPASFIAENLKIELNVIEGAYKAGVEKLLFLGSSCIYPKHCEQPIKEEYLLTGNLEPTNEPYALAKIAGIKLCESFNRQFDTDFRSVMPTNLYGENDNFHPENSHVVPGLIRRFHEAKVENRGEIVVWGSGRPMREFLYVDDMASACLHVMSIERHHYKREVPDRCSHLNVGTGVDCTIAELATTISEVVGFKGEIVFDSSKPDGTPRKLLNVSRLRALGWNSTISLRVGLQKTYDWFVTSDNVRQS